jgi:flagellar biosynthetic protein FliR
MGSVSPELTYGFFLILIRMTAMLVSAPLLSHRAIPAWTRIGFAILFSVVLVPLQKDTLPPAPSELGPVAGAVLSETLFGLALGLAMQIVFLGVQMGSHLLGLQMGFGLGAVYDPISGVQFGALDQFYAVLVTLIFFTINGHHLVIQAMAETVKGMPLGTFNPATIQANAVAGLAAGLLVTAVRVAMPVVGALFLTDVAMGFVARVMPQANVMVMGTPVKVGVGLLVLMAALPATAALMNGVIAGPLTGSGQTLLGVK